MVNTSNYKLTHLFFIAAISMGTLAACTDNSADKTSDKHPAISNDTSATAKSTSDYGSKDAAATKSMPKKKGKASVTMTTTAGSETIVKDKEGVYNRATVMPEFPGGQDALASYVNNHVEYPQQAIEDNTSGVVRVSFVVDEQGKVQHAKVVGGQKVGDGLDEEAIRVVNNMPAWKPGKIKGKNVKTRLELPINFQLEA